MQRPSAERAIGVALAVGGVALVAVLLIGFGSELLGSGRAVAGAAVGVVAAVGVGDGESLGREVGVAESVCVAVGEACATKLADGLGELPPPSNSEPNPMSSTATSATPPTASPTPIARSAEGRCIGQS